MLTIKLRDNTGDCYTSVYPETLIRELKQKSYPLQWSRGDDIIFLFMGNELGDDLTVEQCRITEGSCIIVSFIKNTDGHNQQRPAPRTFNYQYQRAEHIQRDSEECIELMMECITPSTLFMFFGLILIGLILGRLFFPLLFTKGSDFVITLLLIIYVISLFKFFIIRR
ncbi:hypothetical protein EDI_174160 [Entamoeba dispar SAW760]|uniref:Ubiquitin-like domain-containing protein n=1 Tax=Entamoeba dispar (strain ATCC PRA-260 / SAW760) TaxID=370354 RepID=B0EKM1_ENTDS|nr:uncharacterized protein EDI_174160 [Entamoeba dispar SAW760]EDR24920.1 hypothetical protein EDI_174160 [Entamoeba dispar SAW760]|eukprot:EDR24920.1 hypothetical protein EDI_174160 [Entamoeba dispar SAW760]